MVWPSAFFAPQIVIRDMMHVIPRSELKLLRSSCARDDASAISSCNYSDRLEASMIDSMSSHTLITITHE